MEWLSRASLHRPLGVGVICLVLGLGGGLLAEAGGYSGYFGRFGSLTVAIGVMAFGAIASDLLIRAQGGRFTDESGHLPYPYNPDNLKKVLGMQTLVVVIGTIQWGFGDIVGECPC